MTDKMDRELIAEALCRFMRLPQAHHIVNTAKAPPSPLVVREAQDVLATRLQFFKNVFQTETPFLDMGLPRVKAQKVLPFIQPFKTDINLIKGYTLSGRCVDNFDIPLHGDVVAALCQRCERLRGVGGEGGRELEWRIARK